MYGWRQLLAVLTLLTHTVFAARTIPKNEQCVTAVYTALNYVSFVGEPLVGMWPMRCQNYLEVTSIYVAAEIYCTDDERVAGFAQLDTECLKNAYVNFLSRQNVAENLTDEKIQHMKIVEFDELPEDSIDYPVLVSLDFYDRTFHTISIWQTELWSHRAYGYFGYLYWGCILMVGMFCRLFEHTFQSRYIRAKKSGRLSFGLYKATHAVYQWIYTHFVIAFPLKVSKRKVLWFDLPTRIDAIIVAGYWLLSIILMCITYYVSDDNLYWPEPWRQLTRYIADRTGIMSFANLLLIWVFAGRNNIFIWATGWSFAKFNIFHRHVAWIATLQAVVHTIAYLSLFIRSPGTRLKKKLSKPYLVWGGLATGAMVLMLPLAINWMRKRSYEFFLFIHICLSVATIVGCFYHVIIFKVQRYDDYLWPVIAIWTLDRLLRLVRVVYCNLHVRLRQGEIQCTRSTATYDPASNVVRLGVIPGSAMQRPPASSYYYYLYQPVRFRGWESHPFTLGSWVHVEGEDEESSLYLGTTATRTKTVETGNDETENSKIPLLTDPEPQRGRTESGGSKSDLQRPKLIFWIRPYNGWTRYLRDQCLASPNRSVSPTILLEGPYGESFSLRGHESVLLIAGGTGIACAVPYIQESLRQTTISKHKNENENDDDDDDNDDSELLVHDKVHLVWAARETAFVRDVASRELRDALSHADFHASFYITGKQPTFSPCCSSSSSSSSSSLPNSVDGLDAIEDNFPLDEHEQPLKLYHGRPDIQELILQHAQEANEANCSVVIVVSGPSAMAGEARAAVYLAMRKGYRGITFREDSFSW